MQFVIDASIVAAWLLPEGYSDVAETVVASITPPCPVPSLFWFEIRKSWPWRSDEDASVPVARFSI